MAEAIVLGRRRFFSRTTTLLRSRTPSSSRARIVSTTNRSLVVPETIDAVSARVDREPQLNHRGPGPHGVHHRLHHVSVRSRRTSSARTTRAICNVCARLRGIAVDYVEDLDHGFGGRQLIELLDQGQQTKSRLSLGATTITEFELASAVTCASVSSPDSSFTIFFPWASKVWNTSPAVRLRALPPLYLLGLAHSAAAKLLLHLLGLLHLHLAPR